MQNSSKARHIKVALSTLVIAAAATSVMLAQSSQVPVTKTDIQSSVSQQAQAHQPISSQTVSSTDVKNLLSSTLVETNSVTPTPPSFSHPIPEEMQKSIRAQSALSQAAEKEARRLFKEGRFAEAEAAARRSLELSIKINGQPTSMTALQLIGDIYMAQKRYQDALDTYAKAREHTRNLELDLSMALAYVRLGDLEKARRFYSQEKFYARFPEEDRDQVGPQLPEPTDAKTFEASIFYTLGAEKSSYAATEEAAEAYQKALDLFPRNGRFAYLLARKLMRLKRYDEALPMFARAVRFGNAEDAKDANYRLAGFPIAMREAAMQAAAKIP